MKKLFNILTTCVLFLSMAKAQIIPIDEVVIPDPEQFNRGFIIYGSFPPTIIINSGYDNMQRELNDIGILRSRNSIAHVVYFQLGYWYEKWKFVAELQYPFVGYSRLEENRIGNNITWIGDFQSAFIGQVGYAIFSSKRIYLNLGLGYNERTLDIKQFADGASVDMDNLGLQQPGQSFFYLRHKAAVVDISLEFFQRPKRWLSVTDNFSIGYRMGLTSPFWTAINATVSNPIADRAGYFYVKNSFVIGRNKERE